MFGIEDTELSSIARYGLHPARTHSGFLAVYPLHRILAALKPAELTVPSLAGVAIFAGFTCVCICTIVSFVGLSLSVCVYFLSGVLADKMRALAV